MLNILYFDFVIRGVPSTNAHTDDHMGKTRRFLSNVQYKIARATLNYEQLCCYK